MRNDAALVLKRSRKSRAHHAGKCAPHACRLFARLRIPFRSIDLDSVEYQRGDLGGGIRRALAARTNVATIPQVFVGGELVGGCTDVIDALRSGRLLPRLSTLGIATDPILDFDPHAFLPSWLHPR